MTSAVVATAGQNERVGRGSGSRGGKGTERESQAFCCLRERITGLIPMFLTVSLSLLLNLLFSS